jgi:hippurate hydrolase
MAGGCTGMFWAETPETYSRVFIMSGYFATLFAAAALCASLPQYARAELDVPALKAKIETSLESDYPKLDALYKDIHAHPEIAFQEEKTAARLAAEMRALGFEVTEHVGKTGLVAIYKNGDGPTIMVRTELDALPMEEKTGLSYASHDKTIWQGRETFVDHSCGHDIHMASWVGAAKTLVDLKDQWKGTDVHWPARRRDHLRRQGDAGGWPVHALPEA